MLVLILPRKLKDTKLKTANQKYADVRGGGCDFGHMRTQGGGGRKVTKFCGRPFWTAPKFTLTTSSTPPAS